MEINLVITFVALAIVAGFLWAVRKSVAKLFESFASKNLEAVETASRHLSTLPPPVENTVHLDLFVHGDRFRLEKDPLINHSAHSDHPAAIQDPGVVEDTIPTTRDSIEAINLAPVEPLTPPGQTTAPELVTASDMDKTLEESLSSGSLERALHLAAEKLAQVATTVKEEPTTVTNTWLAPSGNAIKREEAKAKTPKKRGRPKGSKNAKKVVKKAPPKRRAAKVAKPSKKKGK